MKKLAIKAFALLTAGALVLSGCESGGNGAGGSNGGGSNGGASVESKTSSKTELPLGSVDGVTIGEDGLIDFSAISEEKLTELYQSEAASSQKITVNYTGSLCPVALPVAKYLGFLEDEGITDVDFVQISGDAARDALASGNLTVAIGFLSDWLLYYQNGEEIVSTLALHSGCASAAVLTDSEVTKFEKGMRIGVSGAIGGIFHNIGLRFINHDGFNTDDFTWVALDAGTLLAALQEGQVDAIVASDELIYNYVESGLAKVIRSQDYDPDFVDEVCCSLGFNKDFVKNNPATVYKFTRGVYRASKWLAESEENRSKAIDLLLEKQYISATKEMGVKLINLLHYGFGTKELVATMKVIGKEYIELGLLPKDFDLSNAEDQFLVKYNLTKIQ